MKKITGILSLAFILLGLTLRAQNDFRTGYIVISEKDTIRGEINCSGKLKSYKLCKFKTNGEIRKYTPEELIAYSITDDKSFVSGIVPDSFVEILVKGNLSLYKHDKDFYVKTNLGEIHKLSEGVKKTDYVEESKIDKVRWKGTLSYILSDCKASAMKPEQYRLSEKCLVELISDYNICKGDNFTVTKEKKQWNKITLGIIGGLQFEKLKSDVFDEDAISFFDSKYTYTTPFIGVMMNVVSPRISDKLSFQTEFQFSQYSFSGVNFEYSEATPIYYKHALKLEYNKVSIPISLRYNLRAKKWTWYGQLGLCVEYNFNTKFSNTTHIINDTGSYPIYNVNLGVNKNQASVWAGLGTSKSFKKLNIGLNCRYYKLSGVSSVSGIELANSRMSVGLIISRN